VDGPGWALEAHAYASDAEGEYEVAGLLGIDVSDLKPRLDGAIEAASREVQRWMR